MLPTVSIPQEKDVDTIYDLILPYTKNQILLPRSKSDILCDLHNTWISLMNDIIIGTITVISFSNVLWEIRAMVVHKEYHQTGVGSLLLKTVINFLEKNTQIPIQLFALTYIPTFFIKHGFHEVPKNTFPEKIYIVCQYCSREDDCNETAVLLQL